MELEDKVTGLSALGESPALYDETGYDVPMESDATLLAQPNMELATQLKDWIETPNIAVELEDTFLDALGMQCKREFDLDDTSRAEWKSKYKKWLDFAMQITQEKTYPWPKASNVIFPLITNAATQFSARAYPAIIRSRNVVKGIVWGDDAGIPQMGPDGQPMMSPSAPPSEAGLPGLPGPQSPNPAPQPLWTVRPGEKRVRADRIGQHMSWQLLDEMPEWEPDTDKLLTILPIVGCVFRKTFFDPTMQRNVSDIVTADQLCVNYKAKSFETVPRITEELQYYPNEIEEKIRAGIFLDRDYVTGQATDSNDDDAPIEFLEQHRLIDLDEDGYAEPYIVTISKSSCKVARIVANYDMESVMFGPDHRVRKIDRVRYYTKYDFIPSPDGGVYGIGFGHLLYPINEAINTTLNQMLDAGHLQNAGGGFIGSGLSMHTGAVRFQIGEYKPVNSKGGPIRDSIYAIPFQGPNPVLFQMLGFLAQAGNEVGSVKDILTGDGVNLNTPATTILAMIEQGMQVFSAIYKRVHRSLKAEFAKLYRLNRLYLQFDSGYQQGDEWKTITPEDYARGSGVEPISDPKMVSDMQRLGHAQFLMGFLNDPYFDGMEIRRRVLDAANVEEPDKLIKGPPPPPPQLLLKTAEMAHKQQLEDKKLERTTIKDAADIQYNASMRNAQSIREIAEAIEALARAASLSDQNERQWYLHQISMMRSDIDQLSNGSAIATGPVGDAEGSQQAGLPAMAAQSGGPVVSPVPAGL